MCHTSQKYIFLGTFNIGSSLSNMNQDADYGGRREVADKEKIGWQRWRTIFTCGPFWYNIMLKGQGAKGKTGILYH